MRTTDVSQELIYAPAQFQDGRIERSPPIAPNERSANLGDLLNELRASAWDSVAEGLGREFWGQQKAEKRGKHWKIKGL